jgi:hypothetical protein
MDRKRKETRGEHGRREARGESISGQVRNEGGLKLTNETPTESEPTAEDGRVNNFNNNINTKTRKQKQKTVE